jgi:hypothetical protein
MQRRKTILLAKGCTKTSSRDMWAFSGQGVKGTVGNVKARAQM